MEKKYKVYCVAGMINYTNWFPFKVELVDSVEKADLVLFEGGEDVSPELYGENRHITAYNNPRRDMIEIFEYQKAIRLGKPCVGVCRGSQLTSVIAGGKLVQDQPNPGSHMMKTIDNIEIKVSSTHHQAQYPFNLPKEDYKILGWTEGMLKHHQNGDGLELNPEVECEVVHYPKINALGIQPHPEMLVDWKGKVTDGYEDTIKWFQQLLEKFLNKEL